MQPRRDAPLRPPRWSAPLVLAGLVAALLAGASAGVTASWSQDLRPTVGHTTVSGAITPVVADHLADVVADAGDAGYEAVLVTLDTPGGLVTSMREIVQTFLNAPVPVVVHVAPSGADAGSAGTFITLAAHVAAMAPATTIGAATPVDLEGGEVGDKIVNNAAAYAEAIAEARGRDVEFAVDAVRDGRSVTAEVALDIGAIDLIVADTDDLLDDIAGTDVELASGETVTLATADATLVELEMSAARRLLQRLADPNLAFIFISIGTLAIIYELANPGLGAGGIVGAAMLILAMFALAVLPVTFAGAALLFLAAVFLVAELFAPGIGIGAGGGSLLLLLGGLFLFDRPSGISVGLAVILPTVVVVLGLTVLAGVLVRRTRDRPSRYTSDELIDREATTIGAGGELRVRLDGTSWRVQPAAGSTIVAGDRVRVVGRDNLDLVVVPVSASADDDPTTTPDPAPAPQEGHP